MTPLKLTASLLACTLLALTIPATTFAAYNDLTLTTSTVISVGGYSLDVSGSSAVVQSITVNASDFTVTLASGSSITISSPTLQKLSSDVTSDVTNNTCTDSASSISLTYSGSGTVTNVITPSATVCSSSGSTSSSSGSTSSGGSILSGYNSQNPLPAAVTTTATTTVTTFPTAASGLSSSQIQAILSLLESFDADQATVDKVSAALHGAGALPSSISSGVSAFTRNLKLRDRGADVRALQEYLNANGFPIAQNGPGSPGHETDYFGTLTYKALVKFQAAHGISPAAGYFGPITRTYIAAHP